MNLRPLGYEHHDARLRRLGRSLADALTSADGSEHGALGGTRTPNLLIRSSMCGHPDPFRSVRDLGRVPVRCSSSYGFPKGCSPRWLPAWLPKEARSRLRRRQTTSFESACSACSDSITHLPRGRDHSAHIPDHGNFRRDRLGFAGDGPRPVRAGSSLAPWFLTGVSAVAPGPSATSRVRWPVSLHLCRLPCGHSRAWG